ncbi:MAG: aldehyde ferredoxin oxidoreductase family protein [Chloroflexota bacterium]
MARNSCYAGRILRVDLSGGSVTTEEYGRDYTDLFIGGRGVASMILYREVPPEVAPLDPENRLIFSPGALLGTGAPAASRTTVTARSPLTEMHGDGHSGASWGAELRRAGYDLLIVQGRAEKPVYLAIDDGRVELRDAGRLRGLLTSQTHARLRAEMGRQDLCTVCVGPAGENLVRLAGVFHNGADRGVSARCGLGAVMGSKNLKAIATRGTGDVGIANVPDLKAAFRDYLDTIAVDPYVPPATRYGTCRFMMHRVKFGIHGAENWRYGEYGWQPLDPEIFRADYQVKAGACLACPVSCRRDYRVRSGPFAGVTAKVEWEAIARCMTCGITDPEAAIAWSNLCNHYGLDVEGVGDTVAFAMECFEEGLLTERDADGLTLRFGNVEAFLELSRRIALRHGDLASTLAEGTRRAAAAIGRGSERFAMNVKGGEMSAGDPRGMPVRAVSYATSTRGSDHLRSNPYIEEIMTPQEALEWWGSEEAADIKGGVTGKGRMLKFSEDLVTIGDILGLCKFAYYRSATFPYLYRKGVHLATRLYNACSGRDLSEQEMLQAGERAFNVEKAYNTRCGATRADDTIPERFFTEPLRGGGPSGGAVVDRGRFNRILEEYYASRGFDVRSGLPTRAGLERLGLMEVADDLEARGLLGAAEEREKWLP